MAPGRVLISSLQRGFSLEPLLTQEAGSKVTWKVRLAVFSPVAATWPAGASYLCPRSLILLMDTDVVLMVKNPPANAGDIRDSGLIPGSGRSPGGGHGIPLQYSGLGNSMDRGAWWVTVHGVAKSWTPLSDLAQSTNDMMPSVALGPCGVSFTLPEPVAQWADLSHPRTKTSMEKLESSDSL